MQCRYKKKLGLLHIILIKVEICLNVFLISTTCIYIPRMRSRRHKLMRRVETYKQSLFHCITIQCCGGLNFAGYQTPIQLLSQYPSSTEEGEEKKNKTKQKQQQQTLQVEIKTGRAFKNYSHRQYRLDLGKSNLLLIKRDLNSKKDKN